MHFLYRLGLKPREIYRMDAGRAWSIVAEEIESRFHLDNPGFNKKVKERKRIEGYLINDFNEPFSSISSALLSSDYIVKPNDKIHIKLVPCPINRNPLPASAPPASNSKELTEEERVSLIQNPPLAHRSPWHHGTARAAAPPPLPYTKPKERPLTGIPRSMRAESYKQLYGQPMPNGKQQ